MVVPTRLAPLSPRRWRRGPVIRPNPHEVRLASLADRPYRLTLDAVERQPRFGFDALADSIAKVILESPPELTLAIYGEWGSGKTTLLEAVRERVQGPSCALAWFDIWQYKNQQDVVPFVIDAIAEALPHGSKPAKRLAELARAGLVSAQLGYGSVQFNGKDFVGELDRLWSRPRLARDTLAKPVNEWQNSARQYEGDRPRVVVIVDNLDRCLPAQAVHLLEQTTSLFDFDGVIFLLAAQKDWIARAVEKVYALEPGEGSVYLEKIVQVEFAVPQPDEERVVDWIRSLGDEQLSLSDDEARIVGATCAWNPRKIKRVLNNVRIVLCTTRPEFAPEKGLALTSTLLLYRDPETWLEITALGSRHGSTAPGPREPGGIVSRKDDLVMRILAAEGGRKLLNLSDAEMSRFLTSTESVTASRDPEDVAVRETLEAARASLGQSATRCDLVVAGAGRVNLGLPLIGALSAIVSSGYAPRQVAGAGAGALVAALFAAGYSLEELAELWRSTDFTRFEDRSTSLSKRITSKGDTLNEGRYVEEWLGELLTARGVRIFGDLTPTGDVAECRLQVGVRLADGETLTLPREASRLEIDPVTLPVAPIVRGSFGDPQLYEPRRYEHQETKRVFELQAPDSDYFPISLFDQEQPLWPTFGIRLLERDRSLPPLPPRDAARTIEIPIDKVTGGSAASVQETSSLLTLGRQAAEQFLARWSYERYVDEFRRPSVPSP